MATLYISYFGGVENEVASSPIFAEAVTTSGTSAQGTANTKGAAVASVFSDVAHYVAVGANPTAAAASGFYLPANTLHWVDLGPTLSDKVAAITA